MENSNKRIVWIDTLKFMGIFSIYLSHLGELVGYFYPFGYRYQTPLFFFVAGAMEAISTKDLSIFENIKRKFNGIVLPYFFFAFISILIIIFSGKASVRLLLDTSLQYLLAIRNTLFAPILWFLPTLFVISVIFILLKKLIKNRWLILLVGLALIIISETALPHRPFINPSWVWNLDTAMYYFFYFALGYACFPYIRQLLTSKSTWARLGVILSAVLVTAYAVALIVGKDLIAILLRPIPNSYPAAHVAGAVVLIWFAILLSQLLSSIELFQAMGRNTLYLSGSEQIVRHLTPPLLSVFGLNLNINSPLTGMIFTFIALVAVYFLVIPFLKAFYKNILAFLTVKRKEMEAS